MLKINTNNVEINKKKPLICFIKVYMVKEN